MILMLRLVRPDFKSYALVQVYVSTNLGRFPQPKTEK